ncbi:MAG: hypothetical protein IT317_24085 [Anaerolineales bacterium]|nr:hypothetical protein [Anaerolineales bacterium]
MPDRHPLQRVFRLGLTLCLLAAALGWRPAAPAAAAPTPSLPAAISLSVTVGTSPFVCASTPALDLPNPGQVFYCYEVTNTGSITLTLHTLVDSELGSILNDFPYALAPGASAFLTQTTTLSATTVTSATWTANNPGPTNVVESTDKAAVNIGPLFGCNAPPRTFETGLPGSWSVEDLSAGEAGIDWTTTADTVNCGLSNLTGGTGEAACADRDFAGPPDLPAYDTTLVSNLFDLTHALTATLHFSAFYNDFSGGADLFRVEVHNGTMWATELTWNEDHVGEDVALDLSSYKGLAGLRIRFRYSGADWDWYAQVDDVSLSCGGRTFLPLTQK